MSTAFIYVAVCIGMWALQDKLVFPGASSQGRSTSIVQSSSRHELIELRTRDNVKTFAVFASAANPYPQPGDAAVAKASATTILFYGNGDFLANALGWVSYFRDLAVNVLAVEYVGYGMADGKPSEAAFYATAEAAYDYALTRADVDPRQIIPTGISIGCAPAIDLAVRRPTAGVVCFSPFTSLGAMGREVMRLLPTSLLLSHKFDNQSKLASYGMPIFITHGRRDRVIPFGMSEDLVRTARGPVTFLPVDDADHNNLLEAGYDQITPALRSYFESIANSR